jgi:hypothetical protein
MTRDIGVHRPNGVEDDVSIRGRDVDHTRSSGRKSNSGPDINT